MLAQAAKMQDLTDLTLKASSATAITAASLSTSSGERFLVHIGERRSPWSECGFCLRLWKQTCFKWCFFNFLVESLGSIILDGPSHAMSLQKIQKGCLKTTFQHYPHRGLLLSHNHDTAGPWSVVLKLHADKCSGWSKSVFVELVYVNRIHWIHKTFMWLIHLFACRRYCSNVACQGSETNSYSPWQHTIASCLRVSDASASCLFVGPGLVAWIGLTNRQVQRRKAMLWDSKLCQLSLPEAFGPRNDKIGKPSNHRAF